MNEYEVRVTRQALEQMKEIVHYISNDLMAPDAADNLLDKMKAEITKLSSFPKKHALTDEEPWRTEGVRKIVVKNFLIYYWVDDENNRVQVTAVIITFKDNRFLFITLDFALLDKFFFFGSYTFQEHRGRFIIRFLWNKFATDGKVEDFRFCFLYRSCKFIFKDVYVANLINTISKNGYYSLLFFYRWNGN